MSNMTLSPEADQKLQSLKEKFDKIMESLNGASKSFVELCSEAPASNAPQHNELDIHRYEAFRRLEDFVNRVNNAYAVAQNRVIAPELQAQMTVLEGGKGS